MSYQYKRVKRLESNFIQIYRRAREIAFEPYSHLNVRTARQGDVAHILNVEWYVFNSVLDWPRRWSPAVIKYWFDKKPDMFFVVEVEYKYIIGYGVLIALAQSGYDKFVRQKGRSIVDLVPEDVDLSSEPRYMSLEVIACMNAEDTTAGMLLIRKAISLIPSSCEIFTAFPTSVFGEKMMRRFNFRVVWRRVSGSDVEALYALDLADPKSYELFRKLRRVQ